MVLVQEPDLGSSSRGSLEVWGHLVLALTSSKVASLAVVDGARSGRQAAGGGQA